MKGRSLVLAALLAALAMALSGCADSKKMEEYNQGMAAASAAITEAATDFTASVQAFGESYSEENRLAVIDAVTRLEEGYRQLGDLEPPEKYAEVQEHYKESAELVAKAAAIYKEEFSKVSADTVDEAFIERLQQGDEYIRQAQEKIMEGSALGQEIEGK